MGDQTATEAVPYLTFSLGEEAFALEISKVREVLDYTKITRVPRMPDFLRGVFNLRGSVLPVIDLRIKLGMSGVEKSVDSCIIVLEVDLDGDKIQMGALVDSVREVTELASNQIAPPPRMGTRLKTEFIRGMGTLDESFLIILDIDRVLSSDELAILQATGEVAATEESAAEEESEAAPA